MSDASDQAMALAWFLDSADADPAEARRFLSVLKTLFFGDGTQPRRWSTFGYTAVMLRTLQTPVVWHVGAAPRSLGNAVGVDSDIKDRCLGRMQAWVALARAAVSAEFPNFELAQSFRIFDLSAARMPQTPADDLSRVARVVGVEAAALAAQWEDMWPRARELADSGNKTAWRQALENVTAHHATANAHPTEALRNALVHFFAHGLSTSGVEQAFSRGAWCFGSRRFSAASAVEETALKVALDLPRDNQEAVIRLAAKIWVKAIGMVRARCRSRIDKGVAKWKARCDNDRNRGGEQVQSERDFINRRRAQAAAARGATGISGILALPALTAPLTEQQKKELEFQRQKHRKRKCQALYEGVLGPTEVTAELKEETRDWRKKMVAGVRARARAKARAVVRCQGAKPETVMAAIARASLHVAAGCRNRALGTALLSKSFRVASRVSAADHFVVSCPPDDTDEKIKFVTVLRGSYHMSPKFILEGRGTAVKFKSVAMVRRLIWVSPACAARESGFWQFAERALSHVPGVKLRLRLGVAVAEVASLKVEYKSRLRDLVIVICPGEEKNLAWATMTHVFTIRRLLAKLWCVDHGLTVSGLQ